MIMDKKDIVITDEYQRCFELIENDTSTIFVSGQAGTGKSVLIDLISDRYRGEKTVVRAAPTGVTALNVNGQTLHSLFKLPLGLLTSTDKQYAALSKIRKMGATEMFMTMDIVIIDEISMVRPDSLDCIDFLLRTIRGVEYPFGGVQVIFVGDMFQLPPVITDDERDAFELKYGTDFFFGATVFEQLFAMECVETVHLTKTFRQTDELFIDLLNNVRVNTKSNRNVKVLNEYCHNDSRDWDHTDERSILLCTTNRAANGINKSELANIPGNKFTSRAKIEGDFRVKLVTPEILELKVGAKVMFTRNNPANGWVNGTLGVVVDLDEEGIQVRIPKEDNRMVVVERESWENMKYEVYTDDNGQKKVRETVTGFFKQFPLTLAYALTIHKSQGLTFDRVSLDLGAGSFAAGQTYVALSRCTSIDGIHLERPILLSDIYVDPRIVAFYEMLFDE